MFRIIWDKDINGVLLTTNGNGEALNVSPRPVFHEELNLLGFDKNCNWKYPESNEPLLWATDRRYFYKGVLVAEVKGGNLFDDPKIEITEAGEGLKLKPIDIQKVVEKNQKLLFLLEQEAIEFIEQTYRTYSLKKIRSKAKANEEVDWALLAQMHEKNTKIKHAVVKQDCDSFDIMPLDLAKGSNKTVYLNTKIDQFIASFSGGKDSQVTLDLVSRVLPPDNFMVIYANTGMEIPPSLEIWEKTKKHYTANYPQLRFHLAQNPEKNTVELWEKFGLPSRIHRWCCTVAKTAPLYHDLKHINGNGKQPNVLVFEGVRSEESPSRAKYDRKIGKNVKHAGVINASPIYYWNTVEVFLYLFGRKLPINEGYRFGLNRVGCYICPFSSEWSEHIVNKKYPDNINPFLKTIERQSVASGIRDLDEYIKTGKWKTRAGGQSIKNQNSRVDITEKNGELRAFITNPKEDILEWIKILGPISYQNNEVGYTGEIKFKEIVCKFSLEISDDKKTLKAIFSNLYNFPNLLGKVKRVLYKTTYCAHCLACEIECPTGALIVEPQLKVNSNKCIHCWKCIDFIDKGCMMAKSLNITEGGIKMTKKLGSLNRYEGFGIKENWIDQFFRNINNYFEIDNNLGGNPQIRAFTNWLKDSEIIGNNTSDITEIGHYLKQLYLDDSLRAWEILWINFYYNSLIVKWYIERIPFNSVYSKDDLEELLRIDFQELQPRTRNNALSSILYLFKYSHLPKIKIGANEKKGSTTYISKMSYDDVSLITVAYSLYRYANSKNRYNLTVSELFAPEQKQGIYKEFGVSKERFQNILRTLQENKNGIVKVDLVMGLDNISLREDLTYTEVLKLLLDK
jgi:phosphoadenosine phosphosulfate reductase